jgi:uncharacterized protein involved in exopolysaccharide biosynthesis
LMLRVTMTENRIGPDAAANRNSGLKLADATIIVMKNRRFVGLFTVACAMATMLLVLLVPNKYTAQSTIMPAGGDIQGGGLLSLADNVPGLEMMGLNLGGQSSSALYPDILTSRQLAEKVLSRSYEYTRGKKTITQSLYEYFAIDNPDLAYKALRKITVIDYDKKTGIVSISVTTKNPELSALVANYYVECLDDYNKNQRSTIAGVNRDFIAGRIAEAGADLKAAEEALRDFRDNNLNYYNSTDPDLQMMNERLTRDVELKTQVYATLSQQYEIAAIQAKKETPIVQALDIAKPPTTKSWPPRTKITLLGLILGFVVSSLMVIARDRYNINYTVNDIQKSFTGLRFINRKHQPETIDHAR